MKTLVLCPLRAEFQLIVDQLEHKGFRSQPDERGHKLTYFPALNLFVGVGGHGKVQFALRTQFLLQSDSSIERVICMGCAGALSAEVKIGDLVVGEKTVEHDFLLKFIFKPMPSFKADPKMLQSFLDLKDQSFAIHGGIIASGDEDILEAERDFELFQKTKALAVAWEGAGGARACAFNKIPYLEVRGITDLSDESAAVGFESSFKLVMTRLADCLALVTQRTLQ